jgi:hypothetical protein
MGTALVNTQDEKGRPVQLHMSNTLISAKFPYKLLALQQFTRKGDAEITITKDRIRITSTANDTVLVGLHDPEIKLFCLLPPAVGCEPTPAEQSAFLARSYGGGGNSDLDLLWKLPVRHGHRNFVDVARQYSLTLPKEIPACTSCIIAKSTANPHLSNGFERATRRAEGFHSDFRGPFSVPTPQGHLYLLTIIDDYSRRIVPADDYR